MKNPPEIISEDCMTRYPILLVHGTSMADRRNQRCWGRIPDVLRANGAIVCFGKQDAWGSLLNNTAQLSRTIDQILLDHNTEKVNIIAHSKGGLESRWLAANGYGDKIASITTISTPHRGIGWLSKIWPFARFFIAIATFFVYPFFRLFIGDSRPNPYSLAKCMTRKECERFNNETPDNPAVYYQSYAGKLSPENRERIFFFTRLAANRFDGDNDGLIAVESAKWANFRGIFAGTGKRGISHTDEIDFFKRNFEGENVLHHEDKTFTEIPQIYVHIVSELKSKGF